MQSTILIIFVTLFSVACGGTVWPDTANSVPPQPEAPGSQPNPEQQGNAFSISTDALYQANLTSPNSPGRIINLNLTAQGKAVMTTDYLDKSSVKVDTGEWTTLNNGNLRLLLHRAEERDSVTLEFKTDGDKLVYTGTAFGTAGLILWVKHVPSGQ